MSLQDITPRLEIRAELYDELLMYAIDHGRSLNGLIEEILVKDLPEDAETLMREHELDVLSDGGHEGTVNAEDPCDNCRKLDEDAKFVAQTSTARRVPCNHGGYCNRTFHWRGAWRCGCPARRYIL